MGNLRLKRDKVRYLMEVKGFTHAELGRQIGGSRQLVYYILKKGGAGYAVRLAEVLGCDPMDLIESSLSLLIPTGFGIVKNRVKKGVR